MLLHRLKRGEREIRMFKRLLVTGAILLMLIVGFVLVPANVAHADSCNGPCGQDPVVAGCTNGQYILASQDFVSFSDYSEWEIRLRGTHSPRPACHNKVWASLVLINGNNGLSPSVNIQVRDLFGTSPEFDILNSTIFYSDAYTNMIDNVGVACAQYVGVTRLPAVCEPL